MSVLSGLEQFLNLDALLHSVSRVAQISSHYTPLNRFVSLQVITLSHTPYESIRYIFHAFLSYYKEMVFRRRVIVVLILKSITLSHLSLL